MREVNGIIDNSDNLKNDHFLIHQLSVSASWLVIFVLVFALIRGWTVLNLNMSPMHVYGFSSLMVTVMAIYGFNCRARAKDIYLISLRNLLMINSMFGFCFVLISMFLGGKLDVSYIYHFILPYIVFLFFRIPQNKINIGFAIIFLGIAFSVISNFIISLSGVEGHDYLVEYNAKLRPEVFEAMSRTGSYLRVGGYTGSYHDSANILGILTNFFLFRALIDSSKSSIVFSLMALISCVALMFTQSSANILIALFTIILFTIYLLIKRRSLRLGISLLFVIFMISVISLLIPEVYIFSDRVGSDGDWENMKNRVSIELLIDPHFWFGHGYLDVNREIGTEIAFLKGILNFGVFSAVLFYWILIFPLYVYFINKSCSITLLPYLAAIVFGFLSLLHYGSLLRITSIVLFYAMYSLFFINMIDEKFHSLKRYDT